MSTPHSDQKYQTSTRRFAAYVDPRLPESVGPPTRGPVGFLTAACARTKTQQATARVFLHKP
eukprot:2816254-Pyramimonas_sp.AAC.1